jgi:BirA family transcriptional regulator, biotin operon repressor / biotin---[acetyl-CoA-carboxylase] ligase
LAEPTFDRAAFSARLATRRLGRHLVARAAVESTNDVAWDVLAQGAPDGAVVVADAQTRGRGRSGRAWVAVPGRSLALSVALHQGCERRQLGLLPLATGLALADALESLGARAALKWPNDLLLDGRKVAGILCESRLVARGGEAAVIGVGVNVTMRAEDFPEALRERATSLALAGVATTREAVAAALLNALEPAWTALQEGDREGLLARWKARADFWGRPVEVHTPSGIVRGVARDLDPDGALVLRLESGVETTVLAGDVETGAPVSGERA